MNTLTVDDLHLELKRSARRKTVQITVERDGQLIVMAPPDVPEESLSAFVREKKFWIYTKLAEKDRLQCHVPKKQFVDGEGFLYLGRSYRLRLTDDHKEPLRLHQGRFLMRHDATGDGKAHFIRWYSQQGKKWLQGRVGLFTSRMEVAPAGIKVQSLGYRWGSCGKGDWLYFHWKTILLPAHIAEYVLVHELAHLHEDNHTPQFWNRVARVMPDYELRKAWLAERGMEVEGLDEPEEQEEVNDVGYE